MVSTAKKNVSWSDNNFLKNVNKKAYAERNRRRIALKDPYIGECKWCGKLFLKNHHSERYCCDDCKTDSKRQQYRIRSHRYYHKHKHEMTEKQRYGLGSGTLGQHMHKDFNKEEKAVKTEMKRLRIKKHW